jgi:HSP20 family molecular chaperone IbpA
MTKSGKLAKRNILAKRSEMDDMFDGFRREIAALMSAWPGLNLGSMWIPLCDLADRGDRYQIHVEVPGIDKDKIEVKATGNAVRYLASLRKSAETTFTAKGLLGLSTAGYLFLKKLNHPRFQQT